MDKNETPAGWPDKRGKENKMSKAIEKAPFLVVFALILSLVLITPRNVQAQDTPCDVKIKNLVFLFDLSINSRDEKWQAMSKEERERLSKDFSDMLEAMFTRALAKNTNFNIMDRANLDPILKEQGYSAAGIVEGKYSAKIGKIGGADALLIIKTKLFVTGEKGEWKVTKRDQYGRPLVSQRESLDREFHDIRLLDTETGKILCIETLDENDSQLNQSEDAFISEIKRRCKCLAQ